MLVEKLKDQWICSCGNWVDTAFTWCTDCCEDQEEQSIQTVEEQQSPYVALTHVNWNHGEVNCLFF